MYGSQHPTFEYTQEIADTQGLAETIEGYEKTGATVLPWQCHLLELILGTNQDGLYSNMKFGYTLPRRNGKTELLFMRCLFALKHGERVLYTAHRTSTVHASYERIIELLDQIGIAYSDYKAFGREHVKTENGGIVQFRTRTLKGGLGEAYDVLIIDEAQEYTTDQEGALKYTVTDSKNPQIIMCGTPPTTTSVGSVFSSFREACLTEDCPDCGYAEWSVAEQIKDLKNVSNWYKTNPSLGYVLTERNIRAELGDDAIDFNIQRLGLWLKYNQQSEITRNEWDVLQIGQEIPQLFGKVAVGIKFGIDGANVAMSVACRMADGLSYIEALDCRPVADGFGWLIEWLSHLDYSRVIIDGKNYINAFLEVGTNAGLDNLKPLDNMADAAARFRLAISEEKIRHCGQQSLRNIATNCKKRQIGTAGGFGFSALSTGADVALLDSALMAYYGLLEEENAPIVKTQRVLV